MIPQAKVHHHMEKSASILKLDLDSYLPEYKKLMHVLNARYVAEQCHVSFEIQTRNEGYHIAIGIESGYNLRRLLGDDSKRILSSETRERFGMPYSDTMFSSKTHFRIKRGRAYSEKLHFYEDCSLATVLALPFASFGPMNNA